MSRNIIVIDLDGTLLNVNTFHKWIIFLFKKSLVYNPIHSIGIIYYSLLRIVKIITHTQLKFNILKISENSYYASYIDIFVEKLNIYLNEDVIKFIQKENITSILATAAPELYAHSIAKKYMFTYCLATLKTSELNWYENIKEKKKKSLEDLLTEIGETDINIVLSDHYDDIPIMKMANKVYLVNGSLSTKQKLEDKKIHFIEL